MRPRRVSKYGSEATRLEPDLVYLHTPLDTATGAFCIGTHHEAPLL